VAHPRVSFARAPPVCPQAASQTVSGAHPSQAVSGRSILSTLQHALQAEGGAEARRGVPGALGRVRVLWRGVDAQLARDVPFSAICWSILEPVSRSVWQGAASAGALFQDVAQVVCCRMYCFWISIASETPMKIQSFTFLLAVVVQTRRALLVLDVSSFRGGKRMHSHGIGEEEAGLGRILAAILGLAWWRGRWLRPFRLPWMWQKRGCRLR